MHIERYKNIIIKSITMKKQETHLEFLQDSALQHSILVEVLLTKVGQHGIHCDLLS